MMPPMPGPDMDAPMGMPPMPPMPPMMPPAPMVPPPMPPPEPIIPQLPFMTKEKLQQYVKDDKVPWGDRNARIIRHRKLFELIKPEKDALKPGQVAAVTNDAKAIVRKIASMISNHPPSLEVACRDPQMSMEAERVEDFLLWFWEEVEHKHGKGPHGSRRYEEAEYLVRDGMLVDMTTFDPKNPGYPWKSQLLDPTAVYPTYDDCELERCTISYYGTVTEARKMMRGRQPLDEDAAFKLAQFDDTKSWQNVRIEKVISYEMIPGDPDGNCQWELGIAFDGVPMAIYVLGYNPLTITYAAGRTYDIDSALDTTSHKRNENIGVGIFDLIEEPVINKNETYSMLREMMARDANPPRIFFTSDEGKLEEVEDLQPGQNVHLWSEDKFQLVQLTPDFRKLEAIMALDQQGIERGSVPSGLWGEKGANTGVQEYMILGNANDQVHVYTRAMTRFYADWFRKILEIYRDNGDYTQPVTYSSRGKSDGVMLAGKKFSVRDIEALGTPQVYVKYSEVTPQNEAARAQTAVNLAREKIVDLRTAREFGLPAPYNQSPEKIGQAVLQDITLQHPMITQMMALTAALLSPDPLMRQMAKMMLPGLMQQLQTEAAGGGQPGQPGQPPQSDKQMPAEATPAEMGQNTGLPEGMEATKPQGSDQMM